MADAPPVRRKKKRPKGEAPPAKAAPARQRDAVSKRAARGEPAFELPAFAADFPDDPDLRRLVVAFEAGDYARVRDEARVLLARTWKPAPVHAAARVMLQRLEPPRLATVLVGLAALLLVGLTAYHLGQNEEVAREARENAAKSGRPWGSARANASGAPRTEGASPHVH